MVLSSVSIHNAIGGTAMVRNKIYDISAKDARIIIQNADISSNLLLVEIQGKSIQSWGDYIKNIQNAFKFPTDCLNSMDRYLDWIRDLGWLEKDSYTLIIHDFTTFLEQDLALKKIIMDDFRDIILSWWERDVELYVVEGKAKPFNTFLVN